MPIASQIAETILGGRFLARSPSALAKHAGMGALGGAVRSGLGAIGGAIRTMARAPAGPALPAPAIAPGDWLTKTRQRLSGGMGIKGNLALGAATVGAGVLSTKALRRGVQHMAEESPPPAFGTSGPSPGYRLPFNTNAYGVPQLGTPLS